MALQLLFMGTGTSAGVPIIGCRCAACTSRDPRDARTRPSVLLRWDEPTDPGKPDVERSVLIDTAPELRQQSLRYGVNRLDAVLFTHAHADHIFGLDDLRQFNTAMKASIPIYAERDTMDRLGGVFPYIFAPHTNVNPGAYVAQLLPHHLTEGQPISLFGARVTAIRLMHGRMPIVGFRVDVGDHAIAYCTDVSSFPPESLAKLRDLDILVIDALRYRHHPTHMNVEQALGVIDDLQPGRAYMTHIAHEIVHAELEPELPDHVHVAFDGMVVQCGSDRAITHPGIDVHPKNGATDS